MDGLELARRFAKLRPDTKMLFMSGCSDALNRASVSTGTKLLEKPFTNTELRERVRQELEGMAEAKEEFPVWASGSGHPPLSLYQEFQSNHAMRR